MRSECHEGGGENGGHLVSARCPRPKPLSRWVVEWGSKEMSMRVIRRHRLVVQLWVLL